MTMAFRRSKALILAPLALALSSSLAFAGQPAGLSTAASHSGKTVPVKVHNDTTEPSDEDANDSDSSDNCTTDPTNFTPEQFAAVTHGSVVCWAAHQPTPDGYANHGAWVSHWAKLGKGGEDASAKTHGKSGDHKP